MARQPIYDAIEAALAGELSRRAFMRHALALGLSGPAAASLLAACGSQPSSSPLPTPAGGQRIVPTPRQATYGDPAKLGQPVSATCPEGNLRERLAEMADRAGIRLAFEAARAAGQSRLAVSVDAGDLPSQGYRLTIAAAAGQADITIQAKDEAGAWYGITSLEQLLATEAATTYATTARIIDRPSFERRGAIIDPPQLTRLRFGAPYKMNLLALASGMPADIADLVSYARAHYVELLSMVGYRDQLTRTPMAELMGILSSQYELGIRSFCLKWDDLGIDDPAAMAASHGAIFAELYDHLRSLDSQIQVSVVLPPYGGIPGDTLLNGEAGASYLALMKERLPADVVVFWTGDGGVFSSTVTSAGARAYASAVGHPIGLWDNNGLWFISGRRPLSGRAADLPNAVSAYMANMVQGEAAWAGTAGEVALLTELQYAWAADTYEPMVACAAAEAALREAGSWAAPQSTCAPPVTVATPHPFDLPSPTSSPAR